MVGVGTNSIRPKCHLRGRIAFVLTQKSGLMLLVLTQKKDSPFDKSFCN